MIAVRRFQFAPDTRSQLVKHLQKTLCTELTNELFQYAAADNNVQYDENKELSAEVSTPQRSVRGSEVKRTVSA